MYTYNPTFYITERIFLSSKFSLCHSVYNVYNNCFVDSDTFCCVACECDYAYWEVVCISTLFLNYNEENISLKVINISLKV